jgi:hypothetical protein
VPGFVGVAVNVTLVPAQIAPDGTAAILTEGTITGLTAITIALDVAVIGDGHGAFEVIVTVTLFPFVKVVVVKVAAV